MMMEDYISPKNHRADPSAWMPWLPHDTELEQAQSEAADELLLEASADWARRMHDAGD